MHTRSYDEKDGLRIWLARSECDDLRQELAVPVSDDLVRRVRYRKSGGQFRQDEPLIGVSTRTLRNWIRDAREKLAEQAMSDVEREAWGERDARPSALVGDLDVLRARLLRCSDCGAIGDVLGWVEADADWP